MPVGRTRRGGVENLNERVWARQRATEATTKVDASRPDEVQVNGQWTGVDAAEGYRGVVKVVGSKER